MFKFLKKALLVVGGLLALSIPAAAQGYHYQDKSLVNAGGQVQVLGNAVITVCQPGATGVPCSPTQNIYSNQGLTTPLTNLRSDSNGNFDFYIAPGNDYVVTIQSSNGSLSFSYKITAPCTVGSSCGGGGGGGTVTNVATAGPLSGGPITGTGTISCATCTTNSAALTNGQLIVGAGGQALQTGDLTGDVATLGTTATVIQSNAVTTSKVANNAITEGKIGLSNVTTNDCSTSAHGFAPIAPNSTSQFLDGTCHYSTPGLGSFNSFSVDINCAGKTNCYTVHADGKSVTDPVFSASSGTVTSATAAFCGGSGPACTADQIARGHVTDVGAIEYGVSSCNGANEMACTQYNCPQGTITAVNSATSVTVSPVCNFNSSATSKSNTFIWGTDDGSQLSAANTALRAAAVLAPAHLQLPAGNMLSSVAPFPATVSRNYSIGISGLPSATQITMLPKAPCNAGIAAQGCWLYLEYAQITLGNISLNDKARDIEFNCYGIPDKDAAATYSNPAAAITIRFLAEADNVKITGCEWNRSVSTPFYGFVNVGGVMFNSGSYAGGNFPVVLAGNASVPAVMTGGTTGGSVGNAVSIGAAALGGSAGTVETNGVYFNQQNSDAFGTCSTYSVYNGTNGGHWTDHGSTLTAGICSDTGGTSTLFGTAITGAGNYDIVLQGGELDLYGTTQSDNCNITGGKLRIHGVVTTPSFCPSGVTIIGSPTILYDPATQGVDQQFAKATAQTAKTLFTTGNLTALFRVHLSVECTTTSAAATVTPSVIYTDTSGTVQTVTGSAATCTTLNASSVTSQDVTFRAKTATNIQYQTVIANTPTYDINVAVEQLSLY